MNKLIFLDLDGVLRIPGRSPQDSLFGHGSLAPECVARFNRILDETGAEFVVISTLLRIHGWPTLWAALDEAGVYMDAACAEPFPITGVRSKNIEDWLRVHPACDWCVIDDELRHYEDWLASDEMRHVFVPSTRHGLQDSTTTNIINHLNNITTHENSIPDDTL
jgi:hypothetical protein